MSRGSYCRRPSIYATSTDCDLRTLSVPARTSHALAHYFTFIRRSATSSQQPAARCAEFDADAGQVSWADMPVTSNSSQGTAESYTAQIDGNPLLTVYSQSNGGGGVQNTAVGVGTTSPYALFSVNATASASTTSGLLFAVASTTASGAQSTFLTVNNIGSTTRYRVPTSLPQTSLQQHAFHRCRRQ